MVTRWWFLKIAVGLLLVGYGVAAALGHGPDLPRAPVPPLAGQLLVAVGALLHVGHYLVLKSATRSIAEPDRLVRTGGLFPLVRHPMYLGDLIAYAGLAALAPDAVALALWFVGALAIVVQARREDRDLAERFGAEFDRWRAGSRLLVPWVI